MSAVFGSRGWTGLRNVGLPAAATCSHAEWTSPAVGLVSGRLILESCMHDCGPHQLHSEANERRRSLTNDLVDQALWEEQVLQKEKTDRLALSGADSLVQSDVSR